MVRTIDMKRAEGLRTAEKSMLPNLRRATTNARSQCTTGTKRRPDAEAVADEHATAGLYSSCRRVAAVCDTTSAQLNVMV